MILIHQKSSKSSLDIENMINIGIWNDDEYKSISSSILDIKNIIGG